MIYRIIDGQKQGVYQGRCSGIREETYLDQKMNPTDEEFASFVRIKETILDKDGQERSLLLSRRWILCSVFG